MCAVPPRSIIPRSPSAPCFFNFIAEVEKAKSLYAEFKKLADSPQKTDALAKAIFNKLGKFYFQFKIKDIPIPYRVEFIKNKIDLEPFDILRILSRWNCLMLIDQNKFRFFIKEQQVVRELRDQKLFQIEPNAKCSEPHFVIFSTTCLVHQLTMMNIWLAEENEMGKFYHYHATQPEYIESKKAPFHHEAQPQETPGLCGLHALNAFLGYRHLSIKKLSQYVRVWLKMTTGVDLPKEFDLKKFNGLDASLVKTVIDDIAARGEVRGVAHKAKIITCSKKRTPLSDKLITDCEAELMQDFKRMDRFILGVSKSQAHFLTFRKDVDERWWMVDSELSQQEAFENGLALLEFIKESYENDLLEFIIPDFDHKVISQEK